MDEQKREYRTYTEEFKLEALELLRSSGKSGGQIERELGITPPLLLSTPTPRSADIPFTLRVLRGYFAWANSQTVGQLQPCPL